MFRQRALLVLERKKGGRGEYTRGEGEGGREGGGEGEGGGGEGKREGGGEEGGSHIHLFPMEGP